MDNLNNEVFEEQACCNQCAECFDHEPECCGGYSEHNNCCPHNRKRRKKYNCCCCQFIKKADEVSDIANEMKSDFSKIRSRITGNENLIEESRNELSEEILRAIDRENQIENLITGGVDLNDYYTKSEVDRKIAEGGNFDPTQYYTKSQIDSINQAQNTLIANKADNTDLASVATSGSYNDLTDKPTIPTVPTVDSALSSTSTNPVQNRIITEALQNVGGMPNKSYNPSSNSGLGRKTFELNDNSNILTQSDFNQANTIYVIPYDFDLNGQSITIPADCILDFEGGSLSNGTLVGTNTQIRADKTAIFTNISIDAENGSWNVPNIYSAWFSDITSENKLRQLINLTSDDPNEVYIDEGEYWIKVEETNGVGIEFAHNNTNVHNSGTIKLVPNDHWGYNAILLSGNNISFTGGEFIGDAKNHDYSTYQDTRRATHEWGRGICIKGENVTVQNTKSSLCTGDAFNSASKNTIIRNIIAEKSRRQGITGHGEANIIIENFKIYDIGNFVIDDVSITGTAPMAGIDLEPNSDNPGVDCAIIRNGIINRMTGAGIILHKTNEPYNWNVKIENIVCENVSTGISLYRSENAVIDNIKILNADRGFRIHGGLITTKAVLNNIYCILNNTEESVILHNYKSDIIINNAHLIGNYLSQEGASSSLTFNKCFISNNKAIDKGTFLFNDCVISNIGFESGRTIHVSKEGSNPVTLIYRNCTINQEHEINSFVIYCSGNSSLLFEDCVFNDKSKSTYTVARGRTGSTLKFIDCIKDTDRNFMTSLTDGIGSEKYVKLHQSGNASKRPVLSEFSKGQMYFDTTLNKTILWNGTNWIDLTGNIITYPVRMECSEVTYDIPQTPDVGATFSITLRPYDGYNLPSTIKVRIAGNLLTAGRDYTYDPNTGEVFVLGAGGTGGVTDELVIVAVGVAA